MTSTDHNPTKMLDSLLKGGVPRAEGNGRIHEKLLVLSVLGIALFRLGQMSAPWYDILAALLAALALIDFAAGMVHWYFDRIAVPGSSFSGRIAIDFLDHHVHPRRTSEVGFFKSAFRPAFYVSLPTLLALNAPQSFAAMVTFWLFFGVMFVPQCHKFVHMKRPPRWIRPLQRWGLMLSPMAHRKHHRRPHDKSYCVFVGWLNPVLDSCGFWGRLEQLHARYKGSDRLR